MPEVGSLGVVAGTLARGQTGKDRGAGGSVFGQETPTYRRVRSKENP